MPIISAAVRSEGAHSVPSTPLLLRRARMEELC